MVGKELKKLNRRELIDIIYQMKKNEEKLQEEVTSLNAELQEKKLRHSKVGSIAEAAVSITDVFSVAQTTADLYLNEISSIKEETEKECAQMVEEANSHVDQIISRGKQQYNQLRKRYCEDYARWKRLRAEINKLEEKRIKDSMRI